MFFSENQFRRHLGTYVVVGTEWRCQLLPRYGQQQTPSSSEQHGHPLAWSVKAGQINAFATCRANLICTRPLLKARSPRRQPAPSALRSETHSYRRMHSGLRLSADMMVGGRHCKTDKNVSGGKHKLYRCTRAVIERGVEGASVCPVFTEGCRPTYFEWYVTDANLDHSTRTGQFGPNQRPSGKATHEDVNAFVNANHKTTSPALVKTKKEASGVETVERTANRLKTGILNSGDGTTGKDHMALDGSGRLIDHPSTR